MIGSLFQKLVSLYHKQDAIVDSNDDRLKAIEAFPYSELLRLLMDYKTLYTKSVTTKRASTRSGVEYIWSFLPTSDNTNERKNKRDEILSLLQSVDDETRAALVTLKTDNNMTLGHVVADLADLKLAELIITSISPDNRESPRIDMLQSIFDARLSVAPYVAATPLGILMESLWLDDAQDKNSVETLLLLLLDDSKDFYISMQYQKSIATATIKEPKKTSNFFEIACLRNEKVARKLIAHRNFADFCHIGHGELLQNAAISKNFNIFNALLRIYKERRHFNGHLNYAHINYVMEFMLQNDINPEIFSALLDPELFNQNTDLLIPDQFAVKTFIMHLHAAVTQQKIDLDIMRAVLLQTNLLEHILKMQPDDSISNLIDWLVDNNKSIVAAQVNTANHMSADFITVEIINKIYSCKGGYEMANKLLDKHTIESLQKNSALNLIIAKITKDGISNEKLNELFYEAIQKKQHKFALKIIDIAQEKKIDLKLINENDTQLFIAFIGSNCNASQMHFELLKKMLSLKIINIESTKKILEEQKISLASLAYKAGAKELALSIVSEWHTIEIPKECLWSDLISVLIYEQDQSFVERLSTIEDYDWQQHMQRSLLLEYLNCPVDNSTQQTIVAGLFKKYVRTLKEMEYVALNSDEQQHVLCYAISKSDSRLFNALIDKQADINNKGLTGSDPSPLQHLTMLFLQELMQRERVNSDRIEAYKTMITALLQEEALQIDSSIEFSDGKNQHKIEIISFLIFNGLISKEIFAKHKHKINLQSKDQNGDNILASALIHGNYELIDCIIKNNPELAQEKNILGQTPFISGIESISKLTTDQKRAIFKDVDVEILKTKDNEGRSLLDYSMRFGDYETANLLLERGAQPSLETFFAIYSNPENLDKNLQYIESLNNSENLTIKAAALKFTEHQKELYTSKNALGQNFLGLLCLNKLIRGEKATRLIDSCLEAGADINDRNRDGMSALSLAVVCNDLEKVEYLLQKDKIDPNVADKDGNTPLTIACALYKEAKNEQQESYTRIITLLLQDGRVDINHHNKEGLTAFSILSFHKQSNVNPYLKKKFIEFGADPLLGGMEEDSLVYRVLRATFKIICLEFISDCSKYIPGLSVIAHHVAIWQQSEVIKEELTKLTTDTMAQFFANPVNLQEACLIGTYHVDFFGNIKTGDSMKQSLLSDQRYSNQNNALFTIANLENYLKTLQKIQPLEAQEKKQSILDSLNAQYAQLQHDLHNQSNYILFHSKRKKGLMEHAQTIEKAYLNVQNNLLASSKSAATFQNQQHNELKTLLSNCDALKVAATLSTLEDQSKNPFIELLRQTQNGELLLGVKARYNAKIILTNLQQEGTPDNTIADTVRTIVSSPNNDSLLRYHRVPVDDLSSHKNWKTTIMQAVGDEDQFIATSSQLVGNAGKYSMLYGRYTSEYPALHAIAYPLLSSLLSYAPTIMGISAVGYIGYQTYQFFTNQPTATNTTTPVTHYNEILLKNLDVEPDLENFIALTENRLHQTINQETALSRQYA